jgi:hypothetical protein
LKLTLCRTKRRRDSGTVRDFLAELGALVQEIEYSIGLIVEEWLGESENGKSLLFLLIDTTKKNSY